MLNPDDVAHLDWLKTEKAGTETVRLYLDRRIADLTEKLKDDRMVPNVQGPPAETGSGD